MTVVAVDAATEHPDQKEARRRKRSMYVADALKQLADGKRLTTEYLQVDEIAAYMRAARSSVLQWMRSGRLRSCRPGRRRMAHVSDLAAFLQQRQSHPVQTLAAAS